MRGQPSRQSTGVPSGQIARPSSSRTVSRQGSKTLSRVMAFPIWARLISMGGPSATPSENPISPMPPARTTRPQGWTLVSNCPLGAVGAASSHRAADLNRADDERTVQPFSPRPHDELAGIRFLTWLTQRRAADVARRAKRQRRLISIFSEHGAAQLQRAESGLLECNSTLI